jgi:regulator of sigma E protease
LDISAISPTVKLPDNSLRGLGIALASDDLHAVTAAPLPNTPAARANIPAGAQIVSIDGQAVANWFDVRRLLQADGPIKDHPTQHALLIADHNAPRNIALTNEAGAAIGAANIERNPNAPINLVLGPEDVQILNNMVLTQSLDLWQQIIIRKTRSPLQAAVWGVGETRYFILQFYVTLRDMFQGSVSIRNVMGPVGMAYAGAKLAFAGFDKLLWFLALISANLAVVNFLPIPVVDGGLFTFLVLEKIQGRPLSNRAQVTWQIVGLVLIVGVFVLVTCQDISQFLP